MSADLPADQRPDIEEDSVQPVAIGEDENVAGDSATLQQALANQPEQEGDPSEEAQTEELEEEEEGDAESDFYSTSRILFREAARGFVRRLLHRFSDYCLAALCFHRAGAL